MKPFLVHEIYTATYIVRSLNITDAYQTRWCTRCEAMLEEFLRLLQFRSVAVVALEHRLQNRLTLEILFVRAALIVFGVFFSCFQMFIANFFEFILCVCIWFRFRWCFIGGGIPSVWSRWICLWFLWRWWIDIGFFHRSRWPATMVWWLRWWCRCCRRFFITSIVQRRHYANEMWNFTDSPIDSILYCLLRCTDVDTICQWLGAHLKVMFTPLYMLLMLTLWGYTST